MREDLKKGDPWDPRGRAGFGDMSLWELRRQGWLKWSKGAKGRGRAERSKGL